MFLKINRFLLRFLFLAIVLYSIWPISFVAADPGVRIEMKRSTHQNVRVAVTQFTLMKGSAGSRRLELEAYKILNLDIKKNITKDDVKNAYIKIQKKIHPDISPETTRLSTIVNEAKEIVLKDIS